MYLLAKRKNDYGFTLIEILVVIGIIGILTAVAIPSFSSVRENAKIKTDNANLRLLNEATQILAAQENTDLANVFDEIIDNSDTLKVQKLVAKGFLEKSPSPLQDKKTFQWDKKDHTWTLGSASKKWAAGGLGGSEDIVDLLESPLKKGFSKSGSNEIKSSNGTIFIENDNEEYNISSKAMLTVGNYPGGYGLFFETSVEKNEDGSPTFNERGDIKDTGYILQFERGYKKPIGGIIVRKRTAGKESDPEVSFKTNSNFAIGSNTDTWWSEEHDIKLEINKIPGEINKKLLKVYIDGDLISNDYTFESNISAQNNYTGFRAWSDTTNFKDLEIQGK